MGGGRSRGKVLIVEDEFLVALQLEDILIDAGYDTVGTIADREGVRKIVEAPQLALVDLNLRDGLSGPQIARELAEIYGARIVYVTANPNQIDEPAPTAVGIVQKPFTREAILGAIHYALDPLDEPPAELEPLYFPNAASERANFVGFSG